MILILLLLRRAKVLLNRPVGLSRQPSSEGQGSRLLDYFRDSDTPRSWYYYLGVGAVVACGAGTVYYLNYCKNTVPHTKRSRRILTPPSWDGVIGEAYFDELKDVEKPEILPPTHQLSVQINDISDRIIHAVHHGINGTSISDMQHLKDMMWEVVVIRDDRIHPFALPGGKILVYTGLLKFFRTDDEIAMLIAHEVARVIARHYAEIITQKFGLVLLNTFLYVPYLTSYLWQLLYSLPSSRKMELEADYIGLMLVASAGYNPLLGPIAFQKMEQLKEDEEFDYFYTRPSWRKRSQLLSRAEVMEAAFIIFLQSAAEIY